MELSIPYEFVSPAGHRFVLGNSTLASADADYIGHLDPDAGITGLLDGADVRAAAANPLTQQNGTVMGRGLLGGRSGTVQGKLDPNVPVATRELYEEQAKVALYASLAADARLMWTPSAPGSIRRMLRVRNVGRPDFRGRQPKTFLITLASSDTRVLSVAPASVILNLNGGIGPVYAQLVNLGPVSTWPRFELVGPITGPIRMDAPVSAHRIHLDISIPAGSRLLVFPERSAIFEEVIGNPASRVSRGSALNFALSTLWQVPPGGADAMSLQVGGSGAGSKLTTTWHHAWP